MPGAAARQPERSRRRLWTHARAALAAGLLLRLAAPARALEVRLPPPGSDGWRPQALPRVARATRYDPFVEDGVAGVRSRSECSASALLLPLPEIDLQRTPRLRWRWKVEDPLPPHPERSKAGDDFAARVYVMFRFDPAHASLLERARHRLAALLYGPDVPGNALDYVWTTGEPAGARWSNPFTDAAWMISLGRGPLPVWRTEEVDVTADYRARFGTAPPAVLGLALMTDSDNGCSRAGAAFADFAFLGPAEAAP